MYSQRLVGAVAEAPLRTSEFILTQKFRARRFSSRRAAEFAETCGGRFGQDLQDYQDFYPQKNGYRFPILSIVLILSKKKRQSILPRLVRGAKVPPLARVSRRS